MSYESYNWLTKINSLNFDKKSVILVGAGLMGAQYAIALSTMKIRNVTVISNSEKSGQKFYDEFKFSYVSGGFEKNLLALNKADLVIISTPIQSLMSATKLAVKSGQTNILVEKPGSLYYNEMKKFMGELSGQRIRIGYNRLLYPSFHKLRYLIAKDGGISSCYFNFTEWIHKIKFEKYPPEVLNKWGISNSLHVISMAVGLIGMPREISSYQFGKLDWHQTGSIFVGSGITEKNIPFSYQADWGSGGRWAIEVMTKNNAYRLIPLEELYVSPKGTGDWKPISLKTAFPDIKAGVAEEIAVMLDNDAERKISMVSLKQTIELNKLAERIFGYESTN